MPHKRHAQIFDEWSDEGRASEMELEHGDVARQVIAKMGIRPGDQILDLGCGNGWATRLLAKGAAGVQAMGVDVSPKMVAEAEHIHSLTIRARYHVCPFEQLDLPDARFQRVFSIEALYYAVDLDKALAEAVRVMRPGATIDVVVDYYKDSPATACWASVTGLPMHYLGESEWTQALERAGLVEVVATRVVDSRGPGSPAQFRPSRCYPDWETWRDVRAAGSLWLRAVKPK